MRQVFGWTLLSVAFILLFIIPKVDYSVWELPETLVVWGVFLLSGAIMTGK